MKIHDSKTILTSLDRNKEYKIYSADNRAVGTIYNLYNTNIHEKIQMKKMAEKGQKNG